MSSSDSDDSYSHDEYWLRDYEEGNGPPLIKKKSRLISAVLHNQVEILRDLLDSPKWYNVHDSWGYSLLQIAARQERYKSFKYLLSIPDFPFDIVTKQGTTALGVALDSYMYNDIWREEYFTYELIKKGACIDEVYFQGESPLARALERHYYKSARLLIRRGADVNCVNSNRNESPLDMTVNRNQIELVMTLLAYGAQPTVYHFERSVFYNGSFEEQETLCLYIFDQYSNLELRLDVLLKLAEAKSPLFYHILKCPIKITIHYEYLSLYFRIMCSMNIDCLRLVIQKFGHSINELFSRSVLSDTDYTGGDGKPIYLRNLNLMLQSELKPTAITFINNVNRSELFQDLIELGYKETAITQLYCYLLSYGLNIGELDLQIIYKKFGCCELFKILFTHGRTDGHSKNRFFQKPYNYCKNSINELRRYFFHPKLNEMSCHHDETGGYLPERDFQEMPRLTELARNIFRKFFIKKFKIKTCSEFYSRLNGLAISNLYKKIINYETILY
ncbi:hypothetical protein Zmor_024572 [Zophobas morio]|uniref:Uncharacterized protein n=1 Tax=Zophobas morio TaxID=2755281 RepID=A0AA38I2R0_9CUCU|nr:hypothetical protein Zmor_024572 [Zophobas morio]